MKKVQAASCEYFEYLLWQNELEYNRRELGIFESYLMNKGTAVQKDIYEELMGKINDLMRNINKLTAEINAQKKEYSGEVKMDFEPRIEVKMPFTEAPKLSNPYFREQMFYYEQNYRAFRKRFCEFANSLEYV